MVFLDLTTSFHFIGHKQTVKTLKSLLLPTNLREAIIILQKINSTGIHTNGFQSQDIEIHCGVFQGAPYSPTIFNLSTDYVLDELSEPEVVTK